MKKFIYSLVLCAIAAIPAFAQETLTVYDGDATNAYVPVYGFYADAYNKCEFIMPADDLSDMQGGTITKVTWFLATVPDAVWGGNFQVYVKEVADAACTTAFLGTEGATLVYEGPLDGTSGTLTIEFANDYTYEGGNLMFAVYQTATGTYKSASFAGTAVTGGAVSNYNYSSLDAITSGTVRDFLPKTEFEYLPASGVIYKPKNIQATELTPNSAVITWDAGAAETSWGVEYKKAADEEWTSLGTVTEKTVTLDALQNATQYEVRVKAIVPEGESNWATATFVTPGCEESDMGEVEYVLTDTYGDGWNGGGKLQVLYAGTNQVVQEINLPSGTGNNYLEGSFMLCYGVEYDLVWVGGTYTYENGFTLTAPDGSEIYVFQGTGSSSGPTLTPGLLTTFTINPVTCPRPTAVAVDNIVYNGATVGWVPGTEEQDLFEVVCTTEATPDNATPVQVNDPFYTFTNLEENTTYNVFVRSICTEEDMSIWTKAVTFTTPLRFALPENLVVTDITKNSAVASWTGDAPAYNFRYREKTGLDESFEAGTAPAGWNINSWVVMPINNYNMGGTPLFAADGTSCMASISVNESTGEALGVDNWLISPMVDLAGTLEFYVADLGANYIENYGVYVSTTGTAPADFTALEDNIATQGLMPSAVGNWQKKEFDLSAFEGQKGYVAIRHHDAQGYYLFVDAMKIGGEGVPAAEWINVNNTTAPVTMEGLAANTTYECQVQGAYEDGNSLWTDLVNFTTLAADAMPTEVTVDNITATTADVNVVGSQDLYNIRYRTAGETSSYFEGFEYGLASGEFPVESGWTAVDADGDGYTWYTFTPDDNTNQYVFDASCMTSASYMQNALTPDDWLISPQVKLDGTLSFQVRAQDPSYAAEHYAVYVSVGDPTDLTSFVELLPEAVSTGTYQEITADLSAYEGQMGYIAFRHFNCTDMFRLNIDNVTITYGGGVEPGEWITVENVESPYTITGLDPETKYEVQVQGIYEAKATTEWTPSVFFTTLADQGGYDEFYVVGTFNDWNQTETGGRIELAENEEGNYVGTVELEAGAEFKVITFAEDGSTIWFGGIDETQAGFFLITPELLDVDIQLIDGSNFRIEEAGTYSITVKELGRGLNEPLVMVVDKITGIDNITVDNQSNEWYNLNGQKLNGKPVTPGIYINGNKKVIVR